MTAPSPRAILFGTPASPAHRPDPVAMAEWMEAIAAAVTYGVSHYTDTLAELQAITPDAAAVGVVLADGANAGFYSWVTDAWVKTADLPSGFVSRAYDFTTRIETYRPGEAPVQFTSARTGPRLDGGEPAGVSIQIDGEGHVRRLTGGGVIATREAIHIADAQAITVRWRFSRTTDPADPVGHGVETGIMWLDEADAEVATSDVETLALAVADGEIARSVTVLAADAPAGAVTLVPYLRTYGEDGVTDVPTMGFSLPRAMLPDSPKDFTLHVQGENGVDTNNGESWERSVKTIEKALEIATARAEPTVILIGPGTYATEGSLDVPNDCVVQAVHRSVKVVPASGFEVRNVFRLGSGCFLEGPLFEGWRVDSLTDPKLGFAVSFRPGAVINRAPYAHKIAVRTPPSWGLVPPPLDAANGNPLVGIGGGVVLADGLACSQYSRFGNIMAWGATPVSHNGIGYCARNGGLINAVNAVSMWAHKHFLALTGGQIILSGCSTQFGDFSMHADGSRTVVRPPPVQATLGTHAGASSLIAGAQQTLIDDMWAALVAGQYTVGWTAADEAYTRADAAQFLQAMRWTLEAATDKPVRDFAGGLFDAVGDPVFDADKRDAFIFAFEHLRDDINVLGLSGPAQAIVTATVAMLDAVLSDHTAYHVSDRSRITAVGHTWTANRSGVALPPQELPSPLTARPIRESILQTAGGIVIASGQDDQGNAEFVGGLRIDARSGRLEGPPFDSAVRQISLTTAVLGSF